MTNLPIECNDSFEHSGRNLQHDRRDDGTTVFYNHKNNSSNSSSSGSQHRCEKKILMERMKPIISSKQGCIRFCVGYKSTSRAVDYNTNKMKNHNK